MRHYEVGTGSRWQPSHPKWVKHMLNKDGSVKKRVDKMVEAQLVQKNLIRLVPSVTSVLGIADPGKTEALMGWVKKEAKRLVREGRINDFDYALNDALSGAAQLGDRLHAAFESVARGGSLFAEQEIKFADACVKFLEDTFYKGVMEDIEVEKQFANNMYGGTIDVVVPPKQKFNGATVDWKTTSKKKPIANSYKLQAIAYGHHMGFNEAYIVQYDHTVGEIVQVVYMEPIDFERLTPLVYDIFTLEKRLRSLNQE